MQNINDVMVNIGYQKIGKKLSLELSAGAGRRFVNGTQYIADGQKDGMATYEDHGVHIGLGLKVGYAVFR